MSWGDVITILSGIGWTIGLTIGALLMGALFGFPIMLARESRVGVLRLLAIAFIAFVRSVPPLIWVFLIFFGIGSGLLTLSPFAAALVAFGLIASANMAEIYRGGMVGVPSGQSEAARALNLTRRDAFEYVILPQMIRVALPTAATYAIGLLKDSAIASTIGVSELAFQGRIVTEMTYQGLSVYALVGLLYILLSLPVAWASRVLDAKLRERIA